MQTFIIFFSPANNNLCVFWTNNAILFFIFLSVSQAVSWVLQKQPCWGVAKENPSFIELVRNILPMYAYVVFFF